MKMTLINFAVFCIVVAMINATTLEQPPHPGSENMKLTYVDEEYEKDGGLRSIYNVMTESCKKGRYEIYKVIDKYLRKEDLGKKILEVAKILSSSSDEEQNPIHLCLSNPKFDQAARDGAKHLEKNKQGHQDDSGGDSGCNKDGGLRSIYNVMTESCKKGRYEIYKVIDKYLRKEDLGKKILEVAKILGHRLERRMKFLSLKLDEMLNYETS
ncbi:hypothetical protein MN116_004166 [Schistosoma mekongi]|uniref:Uncharacterized protein n=1 Tax=Schistosoma mekongi TaxID=38744 RepID=A0AAE1ZFM2_SCHME|nr:hypothetical protein MN116_004166 [Schistosoma mekongi]